jgi:hypothetical protein
MKFGIKPQFGAAIPADCRRKVSLRRLNFCFPFPSQGEMGEGSSIFTSLTLPSGCNWSLTFF